VPFDFKAFCDAKNIPYVTSGKNVSIGNFNIQCPFCGHADPSEHMGIEVATGYWGCWRESKHRGKSPQRLIMRLLHIGFDQANEIVDGQWTAGGDLDDMEKKLMENRTRQHNG